jgi:polar amino acid transport system substrate-binding protein
VSDANLATRRTRHDAPVTASTCAVVDAWGHRRAMLRGALAAMALAMLAGCGTSGPAATSPRASTLPDAGPVERATLAPGQRLRIGVYAGSPSSMVRDATTGEVRGVAVDVGRALAQRLDATPEIVEFARVAEVVAAIKAGRVDFTITNASPARAQDVDFTAPVLSIELGYLVMPGSPIQSMADVDRPGRRIGVSLGSTSQATLGRQLGQASVVPANSLAEASAMLRAGQLDAFATNKAVLHEMADALPGARLLDDRWGVEHLAIAIPKGRDAARPWLARFAQDAREQGTFARAAARAGLRGLAR